MQEKLQNFPAERERGSHEKAFACPDRMDVDRDAAGQQYRQRHGRRTRVGGGKRMYFLN